MNTLLPILAEVTGLSERDVRQIVTTAPLRYKTYNIAKRNGGSRTIAQPAREVKVLQRVLVDRVLVGLPIHSSATAYRKGISIVDNARLHAGDGPILKFDFSNFFSSIQARDWKAYCNRNAIFDQHEDIEISTRILFKKTPGSSGLRLAIGAPSSPILSNVLMYDFDMAISKIVSSDRVVYTRYADDLTFSSRRTGFLNHVEENLRRVVRTTKSPKLTLNESKTILATRKYKRIVTGLVLANDGSVSVGHERKREIRAKLHYALLGKLDDSELSILSGMLAFIYSVEPDFIAKMSLKYGENIFARIRAAPRLHQAED